MYTMFVQASRFNKDGLSQGGGGIYDRVVNRLTGSNLRDGERHALLYTKSGFRAGQYIGPGTHVANKVREGVEPITQADKTAQAHDIRYSLAKDAKDVRAADKRMVEVLDRIDEEGSDYRFNTLQGKVGIKGKMFLENVGLAGPTTFTTFGDVDPADEPMLREKLAELQQAGFGKQIGFRRRSSAERFRI